MTERASLEQTDAVNPDRVNLELTDQEAHDVHHALSATVQLIDTVEADGGMPRSAPLYGARSRLVQVARRLDHERRHHGAMPNPNGPA